MHVIKANYQGNPNIGLFCYATDKYCLIPSELPKQIRKQFEEVLQVPLYEMTAAGTSLLGVFFAGNDNMLLVPEIMFDSELEQLERFKIKYTLINTKLTALGNNLLVNNKICIASPEYTEEEINKISKSLDVKVKQGKISGLKIVGSLAKINGKGGLISAETEDFEKKFLEKNLNLKLTKGTINFGSPYISSGMICNSKGFIVGDMSGGPEIQNADEALGFIEI